ncbi:MAG: hypothetical protein JXA21_07270 [Anaerolineae bacterium]|nr:hypothetical protein [Anaerolineae bacterium]
MAKQDIFLKHGFVEVDQAPPSFHLLVYRFDDLVASAADAPLPAFPTDWEARQARFGAGLTVIRTPQCPYIEDATNTALEFAAEKGIPAQVVTFQSAQELQANSPSPYGVFGIVLDGRLLAYHYLLRKDFDKLAPRSE